MAPPIDVDWETLDTLISLADDIINQQNQIKDVSDEPPVLKLALYSEGAALLLKKVTADYRPRLRRLKAEADRVAELNTVVARLKEELREFRQMKETAAQTSDGL